jgi:hypothetical protein
MGHAELFGKVQGQRDAWTFGHTAELETEIVDALKMRPALRRFGRQLAKQLGVKGIVFTRIDFCGVLDAADGGTILLKRKPVRKRRKCKKP